MRRSIQGVHQLGQALRDYAAEVPIRAVDHDGCIKRLDDNSAEQTINDVYLRTEFPPPGRRPPRSGDTAGDRYDNALNAFGTGLKTSNARLTSSTRSLGTTGGLS
jgi:hypothetical protein